MLSSLSVLAAGAAAREADHCWVGHTRTGPHSWQLQQLVLNAGSGCPCQLLMLFCLLSTTHAGRSCPPPATAPSRCSGGKWGHPAHCAGRQPACTGGRAKQVSQVYCCFDLQEHVRFATRTEAARRCCCCASGTIGIPCGDSPASRGTCPLLNPAPPLGLHFRRGVFPNYF